MSVLDELEGFIVSKFGTIKTLISMTKLEGRLAGLNILPLLICSILIFTVSLSTWLGLNVLLGYSVWFYYKHIFLSLAVTLSFNLIILFLLQKYLIITLRKMSFQKTRKYFDMVLTTIESEDNVRKQADSTKDQLPGNETANRAEQSE